MGQMEVKLQGIRSIIDRYKIDGEVRNSIGNGEAEELQCTTHEHGLRGGECWWGEGCRAKRNKREKKMGQL